MSESPPTGLFASLSRLLGSALEMAQVRLAIFNSELEEEKLRLFQALLLTGLGLMLLAVGTLLFCGFVLMLVSEGYRLAALGVLTAAFAAAGGLLLRVGGRRLRREGGPFPATLAEMARDRDALVPTAAPDHVERPHH